MTLEAVILAIDPGRTSGWCTRTPYGRNAGTATDAGARWQASGIAYATAARYELPVVAVVEAWTAGGVRGHAQWVGLGAARGRWLEAIELAGITRIVDVYPQTWRQVLKGLPRKTGVEAKASARLVARGLLGRDVGPDEAEAVCIAEWAAHAPEVAKAAQRKQRKRRVA